MNTIVCGHHTRKHCEISETLYNAGVNDTQRIILWSGVIAMGIVALLGMPLSDFLRTEKAPIAQSSAVSSSVPASPIQAIPSEGFIEVVDGCGPYHEGACLNTRSGPGTDYPVLHTLRAGAVLRYDGIVEREGRTWLRIVFDEWLRYPNRLPSELYVASDLVRRFDDEGATEMAVGATTSTNKRILVDRSEQMLRAYDGDVLFMEESISTGIELTPTPRGTFRVYKKTPTRYMQGPIPGISDKVFDLPGVPWNLYFTAEGAVIHGAFWHDRFGTPWSNGCVNMPPEKAKQLYEWAELGTEVVVRD